jgi:thiol-disulfide isomerase/thioredoxin
MKYYILIAFFMLAVSIQSQQVDRQKVIVEVGTGTWCPSCPAVVDIIHDFQNEGYDIAVVKYHINDIYQNSESVVRKNYYDFPWYPTTYYDSFHIGYDDWATYSVHESYYLDRISTPSSFSIDLVVDALNETSVEGTVSIDRVDPYGGENLVLHVALTESHIPDNWYGETEVNYCERSMFPDGYGTPLDFSSSDQLLVPFSFDLNSEWVVENMEITYFIQDNDTKEILQGDFIDVGDYILGISNASANKKGMVFPNPASDVISIISKDQAIISNIQIVDVTGRLVLEPPVHTATININSLKSGVYMISYLEDSVSKTAKFVKK